MTSASIEVVATWEWPSSYGWAVPVPEDYNPELDVSRNIEAAVAPLRAAHPEVPMVARVVGGHPAPVLVEASKGAELLVVGSRGHGEFVGMVIGSVSEYCAAHAYCPVLVHRAPG
jgi:nucleotide-binding universal stress UspA family protein